MQLIATIASALLVGLPAHLDPTVDDACARQVCVAETRSLGAAPVKLAKDDDEGGNSDATEDGWGTHGAAPAVEETGAGEGAGEAAGGTTRSIRIRTVEPAPQQPSPGDATVVPGE